MSGIKPSRVSAALAAGAAVAALLTACSDTEPNTTPTASSSSPVESTTTPAPTTPSEPTPPTLPAEAKADTKAGAKAFVGWYIESINYAANSGNVDRIERASDHCQGCNRYIDLYRKVYAQGGRFVDPGWAPTSWFLRAADGEYVVLTIVDAPAATYYPSNGGLPRRGKNDEFSLRFTVARQSDEWVVTSLTGE